MENKQYLSLNEFQLKHGLNVRPLNFYEWYQPSSLSADSKFKDLGDNKQEYEPFIAPNF